MPLNEPNKQIRGQKINQLVTFANLSINLPDFKICQSIRWSDSQKVRQTVIQLINEFLTTYVLSLKSLLPLPLLEFVFLLCSNVELEVNKRYVICFCFFLLINFVFVSLFCLVSFFPSFLLAKYLAFMGNNCETKCCSKK